MTIIIGCMTKKYAIIKSDGREMNIDNPSIVQNENIVKVFSINNECIVGFTGDRYYCERVINSFKEILEESINSASIFDFAVWVQKCWTTIQSPHRCAFIIAGIIDECPNMIVMDSKNNFEQYYHIKPTDDDTPVSVVAGDTLSDDQPSFSERYDNRKSVEDNMDDYIQYVASIKLSVNNNISTLRIFPNNTT